ncbi:anillin-like [Aethina tumida]|uniref:anillin-like n=1 Tax=Aethina tumida TaxID=116153 RepID=UPI002147A8AC|nr:anillin-like [Aethina tumida]
MGNEKGGHKAINIGEVNVRFANIHSNFEKKGTTTPVKPTSTKPTEIKNKNPVIVSTDKTVKDPVFMSVLERKALFEKKSEATIRNKQDKIKSSHIKENTCTNPSFLQNTEPKSETVAGKLVNILKAQSTISETEIVSSIKEQRQKEMEMLLNRFNKNKGNKDDKPIPKEVVSKEELPLQEIIKEKDHQRSIEKPLSIPSDSHPLTRDINFNEDLKHIKDNQLDYPIDSTTQVKNNMDKNPLPNEDKSKQTHLPIKEDNDISMEKRGSTHSIVPEMNCDKNLKQIQENQFDFPISSPALPLNSSESNGVEIVYQITSHKRPHSNNFTVSIVSNILNEVLDKMEENPNGATPSKQGRVSEDNDVVTPTRLCDSEESTPKSVISPITLPFNSLSGKLKRKQSMDNAEGEKRILLKHTVSLYRKQQAQMTKPLVKQTRQPWRHQVSIDNGDESADLVKKAQELNEEVNRQQTIIAQTSQALDLCTSTPEFVGSLEQVEAEKVLLVATHRHQAALQEAQRIQVDGTTKSNNGLSQSLPLEKGTLTISNIRLPLKQQYLKALAAVGGNGFHFICLVKCAEQVVPTKLTTTTENYLCIPDIITLSNIYSDFIVRFEVYGLETKKESTQDAKHHVNRKSTNKLATQSNTDTALSTVKASSFMLLGYVMFSVQTSNKTHWVLNNCPLLSPLEGYVDMNINCELEISVKHKGFLTMFEDIGGFGAWHRRWCSLKGFTLSYWKYPDDEGVMAPIACICLKQCVTENVAPVSTDICTRLHTFLLEIERDAYPEDKVTLVMQRKGDKTIIKHLLSADTKEERIKWCQKFNSALTATRMWGIRD